MKLSIRLLLTLSVIAFAFVGCAKTSDIENIQEQLDAMKSEQTESAESIESQIESIRKSITSLEGTDTALQEYINALQSQITSLKNTEEENSEEIEELQKAVETLQEKDKDLQNQINALKEYVDGLISDTEKWANATFATIEQYNSISEIIADIQAQIEAINIKITSYDTLITSINDSISSMKLDIETLQKQMTAILAQIQSISYVPRYSDGNVVVLYTNDNGIITGDNVTLDFELRPASAAKEIATIWGANSDVLSTKAVYTITKVPSTVDLTIESVTAEDGSLTVTVSSKGLKDEFFKGQCSASVRLGITDGNNDITSEYVQIVPWGKNYILFEDSNFKAYCVGNFDEDDDGRLSIAEAQAVTRIECVNSDILSLSDIAYFCNLEYIEVNCKRLKTLDLSQNPKLKEIKVNDNKLQTIDLTGLADLESLDCSNNELSSIEVCDNVKLVTFNCSGNKIISLNVDNNIDLVSLDCSDNMLSSLYVAKNTALKNLNVSSNTGITSLALENNTMLEALDISNTSLTALEVSSNTALTNLNVNGSFIESLRISGSLECLIGQYVVADGVTGIIFSADSSEVKIVSTTETSASWGYYGTTTGANSDTDGVANTDKIVLESPAARWCRSLGAEWYLPATEELRTIYRNQDTLDTALSAIGCVNLNWKSYWSSTEYNSFYAYDVYFGGGFVHDDNKDYSYCVRAVRAL